MAPPTTTASEDRVEPPRERNRIVVVDDVATINEMVTRILEREGYRVSTASDGAEALKLIRTQRPDMVITDWELPKLTGRDLCKILKSQAPTKYIPVIMLTSRANKRDVAEGLNVGADDYVTKPFDDTELIARVRALFRLKQLEYELELKNHELESANKELRELSIRDGLTRLFNHRYFQERLGEEFTRAHRYDSPLGLMLFDIDHFKKFNDTYGHMVGDMVLRQTAELVQACVRNCDIVARYGGEEFVVVLPEQSMAGARVVAERIRTRIAGHTYDGAAAGPLKVTVSIGVATHQAELTRSKDELVRAADEALYCAKRAGRNRTVTTEDTLVGSECSP